VADGSSLGVIYHFDTRGLIYI